MRNSRRCGGTLALPKMPGAAKHVWRHSSCLAFPELQDLCFSLQKAGICMSRSLSSRSSEFVVILHFLLQCCMVLFPRCAPASLKQPTGPAIAPIMVTGDLAFLRNMSSVALRCSTTGPFSLPASGDLEFSGNMCKYQLQMSEKTTVS